MFKTDRKPLEYIKVQRMYSSDFRTKRLHNMSVYEIAENFWREGLSCEDMLAEIDYEDVEEVPKSLPGCSNEMNSIPRLILSKVLQKTPHS